MRARVLTQGPEGGPQLGREEVGFLPAGEVPAVPSSYGHELSAYAAVERSYGGSAERVRLRPA